MKHLLYTLSLCSLALPSCITHVSDAFFNKAEYQASADTSLIAPDKGTYLLSDGKNYYIELQRIRKDNRPDSSDYGCLQGMAYYSLRDEEISGVKDLYAVPKPYALYLVGKSKYADKERKLTFVENAEEIKAKCTTKLPIRNETAYNNCYIIPRTVTSPHAATYNALGYTTAVVVDVPLSCVGTAMATVFNAIVWPVRFIISPSNAADDFAADFGSHSLRRFLELR